MSKNCRIWETPYEHKHKKILCSETSGEKHSTHGHNAGHGHKNVNSINNYSEITLQKQKEMSEILSTTNTKDQNKYSTPENRTPMTNQLGIQQAQSLFAGAILHVNNLNIYTYQNASQDFTPPPAKKSK